MLSLYQVTEIKQLLDARQLSQRAIAQKLGVSRGTVHAIASGRRGVHGRESPGACVQTPLAPPVRCPGCGKRVYLPCVYCRAVDYARRQRSLAAASGARAA